MNVCASTEERERERERVCVCVYVTHRVCECVCKHGREGGGGVRESERERERVCVCVYVFGVHECGFLFFVAFAANTIRAARDINVAVLFSSCLKP